MSGYISDYASLDIQAFHRYGNVFLQPDESHSVAMETVLQSRMEPIQRFGLVSRVDMCPEAICGSFQSINDLGVKFGWSMKNSSVVFCKITCDCA